MAMFAVFSSSVSDVESGMEVIESPAIGVVRIIQLLGAQVLFEGVGPRKLPVGLGRFLFWLLGGEDATGLLKWNGLGNEAVRALKFEVVPWNVR